VYYALIQWLAETHSVHEQEYNFHIFAALLQPLTISQATFMGKEAVE
jgi:hypothetical protein